MILCCERLVRCTLWLGCFCAFEGLGSEAAKACSSETLGGYILQTSHLTTSNRTTQHEQITDGLPPFEKSVTILALLAFVAMASIACCCLQSRWANWDCTGSPQDGGMRHRSLDVKDIIEDVTDVSSYFSDCLPSPRLSRSKMLWSLDVSVAPTEAGLTMRDIITSVANVQASSTQGEAWKRELSIQRGDGTQESWHLEYDLHTCCLSRAITATAPKYVKLAGAGGCPFKQEYPMCVMRGSNIKKLKRFVPHEIAKDQGWLLEINGYAEFQLACGSEPAGSAFAASALLCRIDGGTDQDEEEKQADEEKKEKEEEGEGAQSEPCKKQWCGRKYLHPRSKIIFVSHQWISPSLDPLISHPDDEQNSKLKLLQNIVDDDCWVFMDYFSIPQFDPVSKKQGIQSLPWYIYFSSSFKVVASSTQALEAYKLRGFCQIEMLSAMCPVLALQTKEFVEETDCEMEVQVFTRSCDDAAFCIPGEMARIQYKDIKNPTDCDLTDPSDRASLRAVAETMKSAYLRAIPGIKSIEDRKHRFASGLSNEELRTTLQEMRWAH
eukprot:TRINITY_DN2871_c0_g1_i1.p1 TRINITY_DN2871_c0_g1~~TRINITY_DN2871_c0_g1_i1.p1  ORF type:complete len:551 (-),score=78.69 TRINITY_DN2871_c0_g1_i1:304-1956(-)